MVVTKDKQELFAHLIRGMSKIHRMTHSGSIGLMDSTGTLIKISGINSNNKVVLWWCGLLLLQFIRKHLIIRHGAVFLWERLEHFGTLTLK